jgi:hypothetical protein
VSESDCETRVKAERGMCTRVQESDWCLSVKIDKQTNVRSEVCFWADNE